MNKDEREIVKRNFAAIVRGKRIQLGYKQENLAVKSKLSKNTIGRLENKQAVPEITTIIKVANGLKVSSGQLFDELASRITPELNELNKQDEEDEF